MEKPLISVIVPVYNIEQYIERCLKSIIKQTYVHLEIILVDDGSTDCSGKICDDYSQKDKRIRVIHKNNGGLSDARNVGIDVAQGEYLSFIDGDDFIQKNMIEYLLNKMLTHTADISVCSYKVVYGGCETDTFPKQSGNDIILDSYHAMEAILTTRKYGSVMAWNKLYKRELFEQSKIRYPVNRLHEDVFVTYKLYYYSTKIVYSDIPLYFYYQRHDSITGKGFSIKQMEDILASANETLDFIREKDIILEKQAECNFIISNILLINQAIISKQVKSNVPYLLKLKKNIFSVQNYMSNKYLPFNVIVAIKLLKINLKIYIIFAQIYFNIKFLLKTMKYYFKNR